MVDRSQHSRAQQVSQLLRIHLVALAALLQQGIAPWIADQNLLHLRLQQIVQPGRPGSFFPGHVQLAPQTVDKLQNAAGFGFDDGFHDQLPTAIQDGDDNRFLVYIHADILDVATHCSCLLGGKVIRVNAYLSLKVKCHSPADLPIPSCTLSHRTHHCSYSPGRRS